MRVNFMLLLVSMISAFSCKKTENQSTSKTTFDVIDDPFGIQENLIFKDTIKVCLFDDEFGGSASESRLGGVSAISAPNILTTIQLKNELPSAVLAWVEPIRKLAEPVQLLKNIEIIEQGCSRNLETNKRISDLTVILTTIKESFTAAFYHPTNRSLGHIEYDRQKTDQSVVLHEIGHAFGLADTYDDSGGCKFGQPASIMCGNRGRFTALQPDDINGVKYIFCKFHGDRFPACQALVTKIQPGPVPNLDNNNKPKIDLGLTAEPFSHNYTEYQVARSSPPTSNPGPTFALLGPAAKVVKTYVSSDENLGEKVREKHPGHVVSQSKKTIHGVRVTALKPDGIGEKSGVAIGTIITHLKSKAQIFEVPDISTFQTLTSSIYEIADLELSVIKQETLSSKNLFDSNWPTDPLVIKN